VSGALSAASVPSVPRLAADDGPHPARAAAIACLLIAFEVEFAVQLRGATGALAVIDACQTIGSVLPKTMVMWDGRDLVRKQLACEALGACRDAALAGLRGDLLGSQAATLQAERLIEESRALQGGGGL